MNLSNNQINFKATEQNTSVNNPFAQFSYDWRKNMTTVNNNLALQVPKTNQNNEPKTEVKQNVLPQDTFDKKDKTKKVVKYSTIGAGILAVAYSAFALIKYKNTDGFLSKLAEPFKVLTARINPNGFKPKADILQNEDEWIYEITSHLVRLKKQQKVNYIHNLYEKSQLSKEAKDIFMQHFGKYFN